MNITMNDEYGVHNVYFHGILAKKYGKDVRRLYGENIRDVFQGLISQLGEGFGNYIRSKNWHITTGSRKSKADKPMKTDIGQDMDESEVELFLTDTDIHVFPAIEGAGGVLRIIVGVVLVIIGIVIGVLTSWTGVGLYAGGALVSMGLGLIIGGVGQLLTKTPKMGNYQQAEVTVQKPSFLFNGIVNTVEQGGPVPLVYGECLTGSTVISAGMTVEQIPV